MKIDIAGQVFGKLTAISPKGRSNCGATLWECRCECGVIKIFTAGNLRQGLSKSCGCARKSTLRKIRYKHGKSNIPEYYIWQAMLNRCYSNRNKHYMDYGGRGIEVCERWRNDFEDFLKDMGHRPSPYLTLDRIDNNGNYEPGNCRWATWQVQNTNQRRTHKVTASLP